MPIVKFTVESDADDWHVSWGSDPDNMMPLFSNPDTERELDLDPGNYIAQIAIRGEDDKTGTLTIARPVFQPRIIKVSIDPGTGVGINLDGFRVVREKQS